MATIALVGLLTGCAGQNNNPERAPRPTLPPRTMSVAGDKVDPCDMLTREQQDKLSLRAQTPANVTVDGLPSPACTWIGSSGIDFNVQFIPVDAQNAATAPGAVVTQVNHFGAIQDVPSETMGGTPFCQVTIDTAPNQSIRVQAKTRPGGPVPGIDAQCQRAIEAATMVMTTLVATASR